MGLTIGRWSKDIVAAAAVALVICVALYYIDDGNPPSAAEVMVAVVASWIAVKIVTAIANRLRKDGPKRNA
ncbi:MAG TPA: hypothetical protein VNI54_12875 [Thermoanaerobaculia bacterium]|nr:hypothetical protein [Thermoanaerobaculia bacterium]